MTSRTPTLKGNPVLAFDLPEGERQADAGIGRVKANNAEFIASMRRQARVVCQAFGFVCIDDLRKYADIIGVEPHHPNAWGAIFRSSEWVEIGMVKSKTVSNHGRTVRRWRMRDA